MAKKTKTQILIVAATVLVVFLIFKTLVKLSDFFAALKMVQLSPLLLAIGIGFTGPLLSTLRWQLLLNLHGAKINLKRIFSVIMAVWPLSIIPGRAGDFARSYPLRNEIKPSLSLGTTIFEKVLDFSALLFISSIGFFLLRFYLYGIFLLGVSLTLIPILFFSKHTLFILPNFIAEKLQVVFLAFRFRDLWTKIFFLATVTSLTNWLASIAEVWILFHALRASVPWLEVMAYLPLAIFVGLLPIAVAGIGTRDSALVAFFMRYATSAQSLAVGLGYSFIGYFLFAILGLPFFAKEFGLFPGNHQVGDPSPQRPLSDPPNQGQKS